jgi:hypothetical protein
VEGFENGEINFLQLVNILWHEGYSRGYTEGYGAGYDNGGCESINGL